MLFKILILIKLIPKLGYWNVTYMLWYRLSLKLGIRKRFFPVGKPINGTFFESTEPISNYPEEWRERTIQKANDILKGELTWFHYHKFKVGNPPNWFLNPFDGSILKNPNKHCTEFSDFNLNTGDIKILWEPSRFDWLTDLARAYRITGDEKYLISINDWLSDWSKHNPLNQGPNWKCGQEASIRVMKLITAAQILNQDLNSLPLLQQMIFDHLNRIYPNINYAIAQDNNHGTSEAAGLYIGAVWLLSQQNIIFSESQLKKYKRAGRRLLINRLMKLISSDGSFSQQSVTYHRVVVDTMSWVLYAMEKYNEPKFSELVNKKLYSLGLWLYKFTIDENGDAPNIGSNDGAMFEKLHNCDYRCFKYSTQLYFGILYKKRIYNYEEYDESIFWRYPQSYLGFDYVKNDINTIEVLDSEYLLIKKDPLRLFLKIPNDKFRPSSCDLFHLDLWINGENIISDRGSYSYNAVEETLKFKSISSHNTVQFDNKEPMPKLSRFLYGSWIKATESRIKSKGDDRVIWQGTYTDYYQNTHQRKVEVNFNNREVKVIDNLISYNKNFDTKLRWYFNTTQSQIRLTVFGKSGNNRLVPTIKREFSSLYYLQKEITECYEFTTKDNVYMTIITY